MKKPEVLAVTLSNGDSALFLNGALVYELGATDKGDALNRANLAVDTPVALGVRMAAAMGVNSHAIEMAVPANDDDWCWRDVYELIPAIAKEPDIVPVAYWNSVAYVGEGGETDNGNPLSRRDRRLAQSERPGVHRCGFRERYGGACSRRHSRDQSSRRH